MKKITIKLFMRKRSDQEGFTFIELVVAILVMGILSAVAIPNLLSGIPDMHLKAAARDLHSTMQKVRMQAVKTNQNWAIVFDTANNKYLICSDPGDLKWTTTSDNTITQTIDLSSYGSGVQYGHGSVPAGTAASSGTIPADNVSYGSPTTNTNVLIFDSQGLGTGGYVYLDNNKGTAYAVGTQTSGVIMLKRWQSGGWQ